jgi:hypothetical protein
MLQELSGLTDVDPIYRYFGIVDKFLGGDFDWSDVNYTLSQNELIDLLFFCLGHPVQTQTLENKRIDYFQNMLVENNEPVIAEMVHKLRIRKGEEGIDNHGIRVVFMWIFANLDLLKERHFERGVKHRDIMSSWRPSIEE